MRRISLMLLVPLAALSLTVSGCGRSNIFSSAHRAGESTDTRSLEADAYAALHNKDYATAITCYSKILESEPSNAEALYGYSAAKLADAGLDIGELVANLIREQESAPARLAPALSAMAYGSPQQASNLLPDAIVAKLDALSSALDDIIPKLEKIVRGTSDGTISPNNADVNLNLGLCYILRAAIRVQNSGISFDTDYNVLVTEQNIELATEVGKDIIRAYHRFNTVAVALGITNESAIANVRQDINDLFEEFKDESGITLDINIDYI